jgi:putative phosphotransacetylase
MGKLHEKPKIEYLKYIITETITEFDKIPFIPVMVSNRHIHLSAKDTALLFGDGYSLNCIKDLLPGQCACQETVSVIGPKGTLEKVRVLAPVRQETQLEVSLTDSYKLGIGVPVNESGNLSGAGIVVLKNPLNSSRIERKCAIAAKRHIHLSPQYAEKHGLSDGQSVSIEIEGPRSIVFRGVLLRVSRDFTDEMHIDTDEANASLVKNGDIGRIIK